MEEEFEKFLSKKTCRGCANHCPLDNPNCNRSKIFIKDAMEEFEKLHGNGETNEKKYI